MTEFSATNCLWNSRREWDIDALQALVPSSGSVSGKSNRALELFRQFANAYYDIYNNGGGNWCHVGQGFRNVCKAYGVKGLTLNDMKWNIITVRRGYMDELEALADLVIDAALEEQTNPLRAANVTKLIAA